MKNLNEMGVMELRSNEMEKVDGGECYEYDFALGEELYCCTSCDGIYYSCCAYE